MPDKDAWATDREMRSQTRGEAAKIYSDTPTQRLSYAYVGRRFEVGLKARF
jgi:hypothetical protein